MSKELSLQETGAMLLAAEKIVLCTHVSRMVTPWAPLWDWHCFCWHRQAGYCFCDDVINKALALFPVLNCVNAR